MVAETGDSTELRDWITCLVCSLTEHLAQLGNPTWYARFAAQALAVIREMGLDPAKINVNGGAIALGHPLGCTGSKLTATLLYEMQRRGSRYGMVTMCVGGGMGAAGIFERL